MRQIPDYQLIDLFSIGHGRRCIKNFTGLLKQLEIDLLIDVRSNPYSRFNPQFRQNTLKESLAQADIDYLFLGDKLGGRPVDPALYINGLLSYEVVKQTNLFRAGISEVVDLVRQNIRVTLMCSESDQNQCHRKHLIADVLVKEGLTVLHINKIDQLEKHQSNLNLNLF
jgi:uncharacterized protein (DUF488 family)